MIVTHRTKYMRIKNGPLCTYKHRMETKCTDTLRAKTLHYMLLQVVIVYSSTDLLFIQIGIIVKEVSTED